MKNSLKITMTSLVLALSLSGCRQSGDGSTKSEYIDHIKINKGTVAFEYVTTFSDSLEVDLEGEFPVNKYGSVVFFNDDQGRFNLGFQASFDLFSYTGLQEVSRLPNGAAFPRIVTGSLFSTVIKDVPGKYKIVAYVDKFDGSPSGMKLAGVALQLENIKNSFPQVSITQSFFKGNKRYASFTLYGPRMVGDKLVPGGLFLVGDINAVVDEATGLWINKANVWGPEAKKYQSAESQYQLMKKAQKVLAPHGIKLHFQ